MRSSAALAISLMMAITLIPSFHVSSAPTNSTDIPLYEGLPQTAPEKVDYSAYHEALLRANNITSSSKIATLIAASAPPTSIEQVISVSDSRQKQNSASIRAVQRTSTMTFCVSQVAQPNPQVWVTPDVHTCGGISNQYSFTTFTYQNKLATTPWSICVNQKTPGQFKALLHAKDSCSSDWKKVAGGHVNKRNVGHRSYVTKNSSKGHMWMNPFNPWSQPSAGYTEQSTFNHLGVLHVATNAEVQWVAQHVRDYPSLYPLFKPTGVDRSWEEMLAAQILVNNLPALATLSQEFEYLPIPTNFAKDLELAGLDKRLANRFQVHCDAPWHLPDPNSDYRRMTSIGLIDDRGEVLGLAGIMYVHLMTFSQTRVRSLFTEALRDGTVVRIERSPNRDPGHLLVIPMPQTLAYLPPVYALRPEVQ